MRLIRPLIPYLVSAAAVAFVGFAAQVLTRFVPIPHVSIVFLAAVVASAALWGLWPSLFAALLSVAAGSFFFYSPIFSFQVADPQDLADLAMFVIVAIFTSRLAASVRARALEAQRRQQVIAGLLMFSERLAASASDEDLSAAIVEHLTGVLGRPVRLLLPAKGGGEAAPPGWHLEPLDTAHETGVLAVQGPALEAGSEYVRALLGQAAVALERARLRREVAEARLKVQGEALREALLNSMSHDMQTPLAAILGSATALESFGEHGNARARRELAATIREESERLSSYIENVLDLTRIRAGQITPRLELVELADIVDAALRRKQKVLARHDIRVMLPPDLPMLRIDLFLTEHALANVLDNASKYAPAGSTLTIAAGVQDGEVVLDVTDRGSGISPRDLARVFDPFYRGGTGLAGGPPSGTGLGLAICRVFVEANGGSVSALSAGPGRGTTLRLRFPIAEGAVAAESSLTDD